LWAGATGAVVERAQSCQWTTLIFAAVGDPGAYLEHLAAMCSPIVAVSPDAVAMPIEDADLAVHRPRRGAVAIGIESHGLH
jgi:hypothetical protein